MERRLFLSSKINKTLEDKVLELSGKDPRIFQEELFIEVVQFVKESLSDLPPDIIENLYFIGSFARQAVTLNSDIDFLLVGDFEENALDSLSQNLRKNYRKHSLLVVKSMQEIEEVIDSKLLVSTSMVRSVFDSEKTFEFSVKKEVKNLVKKQLLQRRQRYGFEAGRLLSDLKYSAGGQVDLNILKAFKVQTDQDICESVFFISKLRNLIQLNFDSDKFYPVQASKVYRFFSCDSASEFLNTFYTNIEKTRGALDNFFGVGLKPLEFFLSSKATPSEVEEIKLRIKSLFGVVNSISHHQFTVGEHLLATVREMDSFIHEFSDKFKYSEFEIDVLIWASIFHDLGKDQSEKPHSIKGFDYANDFGCRHGWPTEKTKLVAWLTREHLTLAKHAFKSDPLKDSLIERLYAKGIESRRAVLLFTLTCADSKATNIKSWSEWKKDLLETVLNRVLNVNQDKKSQLLALNIDKSNSDFLNNLDFSKLKMIPASVINSDLKKKIIPGFRVLESEGVAWIRYFQSKDEDGLALKTLKIIEEAGAYLHQAFFTTNRSDKSVYNFFKIETGVSIEAFEKRLNYNIKNFKEEGRGGAKPPLVAFLKVQLRFKEESKSYAVISFRGKDQNRFLLSCVERLFHSRMNILWGHAFTWGEEVEDVFGVEFQADSDWSFLMESSSISNPQD